MTLKEYTETYKSDLPECIKECLKFFETKNPKPDSETITKEEIKKVKQIMQMTDEEFNKMKLSRKWGCIMVSTPDYMWASLAGTEWAVNLEKNEKILWWES